MTKIFNFAYIGPAESAEEALQRLADYHGPLAVDTETIALKGDKSTVIEEVDEEGNITPIKVFMDAKTCIGIGCAISMTEGFYFPLGKRGWKNVPICDPYPVVRKLADSSVKVFFNSMFDLDRIENSVGVEVENWHDVAIACQVQGLWNSLDQNSGHLLGEEHAVISEVMPKGKTMLDVPFERTAFKCIADCLTTFKLYELMHLGEWESRQGLEWSDHVGRVYDVTPKIKECYEVDQRTVPILRRMSKRGLVVRPDVVKKWHQKLTKEMQQYDQYFSREGINPLSNDQVGWLMANRGHYVPLTESGKHFKVSEEVLLGLGDPMGYMVLARRRRQKLFGTYIKPFGIWDEQGRLLGVPSRVRTHFRLDLATGRLGSYEFNSQNLPPSMRELFEADRGVWRWIDLHQAEMRVWANQAKDEVMLKAFAENSSPHDATLKALYPVGTPKRLSDGSSSKEYVSSKSYNFALLADASAEVLAKTTGKTASACQYYKDKLYELYWKSKQHQDEMRIRHRPWFYPDWVEDDFGRRCHIPDASAVVSGHHQEKCRLNYTFQATVASVVKRQMLILDGLNFDNPWQVHDEIVQDGEREFPVYLEEVHPQIRMPFEDSGAQKTWV